MVAFTRKLGMKASWIGKHTLFRPPFGFLFRALGGIPIDRTKPQGLVDQVVEQLERHDRLALIIAPEGTRKKTAYWKSGFYHIAVKADLPIVLASVDYVDKRAVFAPPFRPSGNIESDFEMIRRFYKGKRGKYPEKTGEIRVRPGGNSQDRPQ